MIICGVKLTHDGGIALIDGDRLVCSIEAEKIADNPRHQHIHDLSWVSRMIDAAGYSTSMIDKFVIDGWDGAKTSQVALLSDGIPVTMTIASYAGSGSGSDLLTPYEGHGLKINGVDYRYDSYPHVAGHVSGAWCSSPFGREASSSYVLVWDGAMYPTLYYVDAARRSIEKVEILFSLIGHSYAIVSQYFGPFKRKIKSELPDDLGVAGKLMAYVALGSADETALGVFQQTYLEMFEADTGEAVAFRSGIRGIGATAERSVPWTHRFFERCVPALGGLSEVDVLASYHMFLQRFLVARLRELMGREVPSRPRNLCIAGGCGLNIKWNTAVRESGLFERVWVPPFPNDSGSAIGAACCALMTRTGFVPIDWAVASGPGLVPVVDLPAAWTSRRATIRDLADILHKGEPAVLLSGLAEIGPRALGGRSIVAAATSPTMKDRLNAVKKREWYRPVAPVCLEDRAPEIFEPGTPDPYMIFEHRIRPEWAGRVPAIMHLDGTARLQTVRRDEGSAVSQLLIAYEELTGCPLLCNTSANGAGRGFFPGVSSAMAWGGVDVIWCDGVLYSFGTT